VSSCGTHRRNAGQSRQTRPALLAFREADALFSAAENQIALLRRSRPANGPAALSAWLEALRRGQRHGLHWTYPPPPDFGDLRGALERAAQRLGEAGPLGLLYAERATELELEAQLAEHVGRPDFARLARRRHDAGTTREWDTARREAVSWAGATVTPHPGPRQRSDDRQAPDSLLSLLTAEIGRLRLPIRVQVVRELASRAACGDGVIFVRAGEALSVAEARRITAHELLGHALPRLAARAHPLGLLRVGSARSSDDEEGRALHIEAQHGALDATRRRELGLRHLVALDVAAGASAEECVLALGRFGCTLDDAAALYARVARGGGLCRELQYLPAWLRFRALASDDPELADWLSRGRVSVDAARVLRGEGVGRHEGAGAFSTCQSQPPGLPVALREEGA
jgi:uncharacterized protein DUF1704